MPSRAFFLLLVFSMSASGTTLDFENGLSDLIEVDSGWSVQSGPAHSGTGSLTADRDAVFRLRLEGKPVSVRFFYRLENVTTQDSLIVSELNPRRVTGDEWREAFIPATTRDSIEFRFDQRFSGTVRVDDIMIGLPEHRKPMIKWSDSGVLDVHNIDAVNRSFIKQGAAGAGILRVRRATNPIVYKSQLKNGFLESGEWRQFKGSGFAIVDHATEPSQFAVRSDGVIKIHDFDSMSVVAEYEYGPTGLLLAVGDLAQNGGLQAVAYDRDSSVLEAHDLESGMLLWTIDVPHELASWIAGDFRSEPGLELILATTPDLMNVGPGIVVNLSSGSSVSYPLGFGSELATLQQPDKPDRLVFISGKEIAIFDADEMSPIGVIRSDEYLYSVATSGGHVYARTDSSVEKYDPAGPLIESITTHPHYERPKGLRVGDIGDGAGQEIVLLTYEGLLVYGEATGEELWTSESREMIKPHQVIAADVDGDSVVELVTVSDEDSVPVARHLESMDVSRVFEDLFPSHQARGGELLVGRVDEDDLVDVATLYSTELNLFDPVSGQIRSQREMGEAFRYLREVRLIGDRRQVLGKSQTLRHLSLEDGSLLWDSTIFEANVDAFDVGQLDEDEQPEIAFLNEDGVLRVVDGESHAVQWSRQLHGDATIAVAFEQLVVGTDAGLEIFTQNSDSRHATVPLVHRADQVWAGRDARRRYLFARDIKAGMVSVITLPEGTVSAAQWHLPGIAWRSQALAVESEAGLLLVIKTDNALISGQIGVPEFPIRVPLLRNGFERP